MVKVCVHTETFVSGTMLGQKWKFVSFEKNTRLNTMNTHVNTLSWCRFLFLYSHKCTATSCRSCLEHMWTSHTTQLPPDLWLSFVGTSFTEKTGCQKYTQGPGNGRSRFCHRKSLIPPKHIGKWAMLFCSEDIDGTDIVSTLQKQNF